MRLRHRLRGRAHEDVLRDIVARRDRDGDWLSRTRRRNRAGRIWPDTGRPVGIDGFHRELILRATSIRKLQSREIEEAFDGLAVRSPLAECVTGESSKPVIGFPALPVKKNPETEVAAYLREAIRLRDRSIARRH